MKTKDRQLKVLQACDDANRKLQEKLIKEKEITIIDSDLEDEWDEEGRSNSLLK